MSSSTCPQPAEFDLQVGENVVTIPLCDAAGQPLPPTEADLAAEFESRREDLRRPPRYSIEHIYFNAAREPEAEAAIARIKAENLDAQAALQLSSPFLPGYRFTRQSPDQLARQFGSEFVANLQAADPQERSWVGPIRSTYGLHYVWVEEVEAGRDATLEEVRTQLLRDLESRAGDEALQRSIEALREQYEVVK